MNIENIDKAIAIMKRAQERDSVNMCSWQTPVEYGCYCVSETELHACGNKACFAGHIAISPEWWVDGGRVYGCGAPYIVVDDIVCEDSLALSHWFGISDEITGLMIYPGFSDVHLLYGVAWEDVRAEHVIKALEELKTLGEEAFMKKYDIQ